MSKGRVWYEVRVREQLSPSKWVKKSKFFFARGSKDAASKYKGGGYVMWTSKVGRERPWGFGEFFSLGDRLLRELRDDSLLSQMEAEREKNKNRRRYDRRRKEAANKS